MSDFFDSATLSRGLQYATDGRATIEEIDVADTSLYVYGKCQGTRKRPYEVDVWLDIDPETGTVSRLDSECSCPVGTQCKHGVAVVLNALVQGVAPLRGGDETSLLPAEADFEPSQAAIDWLKEFDASPPMPMPQPASGSRLIYQLDPEHSSITVGKSRCLRKGGFGKPSPYMPTYNYQVRGSGDPVQPEDVPVLKLCTACQGPAHYYQRELVAELKGEAGFLLLRQAVRTGRLFLIGDMERPLREGGARRIELEWRRDPQRRQRLAFETPDRVAKLATWPLAYYAHDSGEVGELTSGLPEDLVRHIFSAPPLNEADARMVRERLAAVGRERTIPLPLPQVQETEAPPGAPAARLTLTQGRFRHQPKSRQADELALAELSFDYPGLPTVSGSETPPALMRVNRGGSPRTFARLLDAEAAVWRVLQAAGQES
ncbi:MAG: SWIM zinc finger family protein [Rhodocyclaceae bacterium]|nr:SWIM zinc finger family protein [Rhodocyclaceae bacterium]